MDKKKLNERLLENIRSGDLRGVEECLAKGADVNAPGRYGLTPLLFALFHLCLTPELLDILLSAGADYDARSEEGESALSMLMAHYPKLIGPEGTRENMRKKTVDTFLSLARTLLSAPADPNSTCNEGRTPAIELAFRGNLNEDTLPVLELIKNAGGDLNARDHMGWDMVYYLGMTRRLNKKLLVGLIEMGVNIVSWSDPDSSGVFSLLRARTDSLTKDIAEGLIEAEGRDVLKLTDSKGRNLLMAYCPNAHLGFKFDSAESPVDFMLLHGLDINHRDNEGETALTLAARGRPEADYFRFLAARGADIYHAPNGWNTYIARSVQKNHLRNTWEILQDFALLSGDIKKGFPGLGASQNWENSPHLAGLIKNSRTLTAAERSALAILLSSLLLPFRNEPLLETAHKNRARGIRGIGKVLGKGAELLPLFTTNLLRVINSMPSVKDSLSRGAGVDKETAEGLVKLLSQGVETCEPEAMEFIKKHVKKKVLEAWIAQTDNGNILASRLVAALRARGRIPSAVQGDVSF